ncbi:MAG: hypothetical protein U1F54_07275 [Burkholderiales bacterium]
MKTAAVGLSIALLGASTVADAQWVAIAKRAIGRVQQISQQSQQPGGASYDTAAVMLQAQPNKVYAAVLRGLANAQGITITREVPGDGLVEFTNGQQIAGVKVSAIGDDLTHMLISSAHVGNQPNAAELVLNGVLRVCREMNVECSQSRQ